MKKLLILTAAFVFSLAFGANAQEHRGPRGPHEKMTPEQQATRMVERLHKELQLTEKQQAELKAYFTATYKKRQENREKNMNDREAFRKQMQEEQAATDAELKKVLTEKQYKTYQENEQKRREERQRHPAPPRGERPQR